ncbi:AMP-binding protein [Nonomuraea sp. B19D2]|uniref:AMP-binding protein n=1 Tax=Nonomuraea sp. B19D2 TaxID=3159561 RepID=UPI0032DA7EFD
MDGVLVLQARRVSGQSCRQEGTVMTWDLIQKTGRAAAPPNLADYENECRAFSWEAAQRSSFRGLPGGRGLNIAYEAVDRHLDGARRDHVGLRCVGKDDQVVELTYRDLHVATNYFANVLRGLGVGKGERVFTLLGRMPELYVTVLGTLKNLSVLSPLFSAFGPEPIRERLRLGDGRDFVDGQRPVPGRVRSHDRVSPAGQHTKARMANCRLRQGVFHRHVRAR